MSLQPLSTVLTLLRHRIHQVCAIVMVVSELCAAGANFRFHIDDETSETDLLFQITETPVRLPEVLFSAVFFFGGGGVRQTGHFMPGEGRP